MVYNYIDLREVDKWVEHKLPSEKVITILNYPIDQKNSIFTGTSDEGELFVVDWCVRPTEENTKADMV